MSEFPEPLFLTCTTRLSRASCMPLPANFPFLVLIGSPMLLPLVLFFPPMTMICYLLTLLEKECSNCIWNSLVFFYLASHGEWLCLRCLSFCGWCKTEKDSRWSSVISMRSCPPQYPPSSTPLNPFPSLLLKCIRIHVYEYTERMFASNLSHRDRKPKYLSKF